MTEYCVEGYGEQGIELAVVVGLLLVLNGRGGREFERFGNSRSFGSFGRQAASPFCLKQEGAFSRGSSVIGGEDSQRFVLCPLSLTLSLSSNLVCVRVAHSGSGSRSDRQLQGSNPSCMTSPGLPDAEKSQEPSFFAACAGRVVSAELSQASTPASANHKGCTGLANLLLTSGVNRLVDHQHPPTPAKASLDGAAVLGRVV